MKNIFAIVILVIGISYFALGQTQTQPEQKASTHRQREKEALKLLGTAGNGEVSVSCPNFSTAMESRSIIIEWLSQRDLADKLHDTAIKMAAKKCSKQSVYFPTEKYPEIERIKGILGNENETEAGEINLNGIDIKLTWYKYGWLHFGAESEIVKIVRIDFSKSGF